jgi:predicted dehydrogenase
MWGMNNTGGTAGRAFSVAILGASGIGRNHARWFWKHDCRVGSFLGSSPESVRKTEEALRAGFPFEGRGYHDLSRLLESERPDIVCISTPPGQHEAQVRACLQAGAHVLCEKPLLFEPGRGAESLQPRARALVAEAHAKDLVFGTQMQYAAVVDELRRAAGHQGQTERFEMLIETKNVKGERGGAQLWIDLSPHPLSVLQVLAGHEAELDANSVRCVVEKSQTRAQFEVRGGGKSIGCDITVRFDPNASPPRRTFLFDGASVEVSGHREPSGEFRALLTNARGEKIVCDDFVDTLVGDFLSAVRGEKPLRVTGEMGAQNVAWQHEILAASRDGAETFGALDA